MDNFEKRAIFHVFACNKSPNTWRHHDAKKMWCEPVGIFRPLARITVSTSLGCITVFLDSRAILHHDAGQSSLAHKTVMRASRHWPATPWCGPVGFTDPQHRDAGQSSLARNTVMRASQPAWPATPWCVPVATGPQHRDAGQSAPLTRNTVMRVSGHWPATPWCGPVGFTGPLHGVVHR